MSRTSGGRRVKNIFCVHKYPFVLNLKRNGNVCDTTVFEHLCAVELEAARKTTATEWTFESSVDSDVASANRCTQIINSYHKSNKIDE
jgi:hypothetical protein